MELRLPNDSLSYHYGHQYHYHQDLNFPVTTFRFLGDLDFLLSTLPWWFELILTTSLHFYHYGHQYHQKLNFPMAMILFLDDLDFLLSILLWWFELPFLHHSLFISSRSPLHRHQDLNLTSGQWWGWRGVVNLANTNEAILGLIGLLFKFLHGLHLLLHHHPHHHSHLHHRHHHCHQPHHNHPQGLSYLLRPIGAYTESRSHKIQLKEDEKSILVTILEQREFFGARVKSQRHKTIKKKNTSCEILSPWFSLIYLFYFTSVVFLSYQHH